MRKQAVSLRPVATSSAGGLSVQKFWDLQRSSTLVGKRGILRVPCFQEPTYFGLFIGFQCPHCSFCGLTAMSILYLGPIYSAEEKNAAKQRPFNNVNTRERLGIIGIVNEGAVYLKRTYAQHDFRDAILQKTLNIIELCSHSLVGTAKATSAQDLETLSLSCIL